MRKKSSLLTVISVVCTLILCPLIIYFSREFISGKSYYLAAVLMIICAVIPFFVYFEKREIKTAEIVILAIMTALAVASRSVLMFLPQIKPTAAIVIITACAFGPNCGFLTGALSMFLSNFIFGQGMFTPFQMLGMGLTGFFAGLIFSKSEKLRNKYIISITGGFLTFFVYGICVDISSVLMLTDGFSLKNLLPVFASGLTFNISHCVTTAIVLFLTAKPMLEKFMRLRIKYGIFEQSP
ncbi:MAG: ECF transporter S component [Ruminococcaceae bacterium]|nr:ECF transporter S component [Oscillospiraceae bacterium]